MRLIDLTGQVFGRLTVLHRHTDSRSKRSRWVCLCDCGSSVVVFSNNLRRGHTQSCGCLVGDTNTKHGFHADPRYMALISMRQRCLNPNNPSYPNYGGRGIQVCERWLDPEMGVAWFLKDVGERPPNPEGWDSRKAYYSLDRIDNDGDYEPGNVRWATPSQQQSNRRVSF